MDSEVLSYNVSNATSQPLHTLNTLTIITWQYGCPPNPNHSGWAHRSLPMLMEAQELEGEKQQKYGNICFRNCSRLSTGWGSCISCTVSYKHAFTDILIENKFCYINKGNELIVFRTTPSSITFRNLHNYRDPFCRGLSALKEGLDVHCCTQGELRK